jgi:hypothetical protein
MKAGIYLLLFVSVVLAIISCDTSNNIESPDKNFFVKFYGDDGDQTGVDMIVLSNGNYLLLGTSVLTTFSGQQKRIFLVETNAEGKIIWQKHLGGMNDIARDMEPTSDGNFIILAEDQTSSSNFNVKLIKITPGGEKIDSTVYGTPLNDFPQTVTSLLDGGYIVTGSTQYDITNPPDPTIISNIFHFRFDSNLDKFPNWYEVYGNTDRYDAATKAIQESNTVFYVFSYSNREHNGRPPGKVNLQYYAIEGGAIPQNVSYLGDFDQDTRSAFAMRVPQELGGGFFLLGTQTSITGAITLHVSKLRPDLEFNPTDDEQLDQEVPIPNTILQAVSAAPSIKGAPQGYLLLANEFRNIGATNIWLTKIDQSGFLIWSVSLGSEEENDTAAAVTELPDGKILVLGTIGLGDNQSKMALFKLNSAGRLQD